MDLNEDLVHFWSYKSLPLARRYLDDWIWAAARSRLEPMVKFAYTLIDHRELLLNWFECRSRSADEKQSEIDRLRRVA